MVLSKLNTKIIGKKINRFEEIDSTNDEAKRLISIGAEEGDVIIALSQTKGKGRIGRTWFSPFGGIYLTIIIKPFVNLMSLGQITLLASIAVVRAINGLTGLSATIRWPNDILISDKKVGGILAEVEGGADGSSYVIVGIGVDVNIDIDAMPLDFKAFATSIKNEIGKEINISKLVNTILEEFDGLYIGYLNNGFEGVKKELEHISSTLGKWIKIICPDREIEGKVNGIGDSGELILKVSNGTIQKVMSGDVIYVKY